MATHKLINTVFTNYNIVKNTYDQLQIMYILLHDTYEYGDNLLQYVIRNYGEFSKEILHNIIDNTVNLNHINDNKTNVLILALEASPIGISLDIIIKLIRKGVDINEKNMIGNTPFLLAVKYSATVSSRYIIKEMLDAGADINSMFGPNSPLTPLMVAAEFSSTTSSLDTVMMLLDEGADVNHRAPPYSALMMAALCSSSTSSLETVRELINAGAKINMRYNGCSAFREAVRHSSTTSSIETVRLLIDKYPDVLALDGGVILMIAASNLYTSSNIDTVHELIRAGVKLTPKQVKNVLTNLRIYGYPTHEIKKIFGRKSSFVQRTNKPWWKRIFIEYA